MIFLKIVDTDLAPLSLAQHVVRVLAGGALFLRGALLLALLSSFSVEAGSMKVPIYFEPNQGQFDPEVRFLARGAKYRAWITDHDLVLQVSDDPQPARIRFGIQTPRKVEGIDRQIGTSDYYKGNDPKKWTVNVPSFAKAKLHDVYPGIDIVFYGRNDTGSIEYDLIVNPGADPRQISIDFDPAANPKRGAKGDVTLYGKFRHDTPLVHQRGKAVAFRSRLEGNSMRFEIDDYDREQPLAIDPVVSYISYLGGTFEDYSNSIAVGYGSAIIAGSTRSADFPRTNFAIQNLIQNDDVMVTRIANLPEGSHYPRLYSGYFGGSQSDIGMSVAATPAGSAYITGITTSTDFPILNAWQPAPGGKNDTFVLRIGGAPGPQGYALEFSSYLGGPEDDNGLGIGLAKVGDPNVFFITGWTASGSTFPLLNASQTSTKGIGGDAFVAKFVPPVQAGLPYTMAYSTLVGGSNADIPSAGIAIRGSGEVYIAGNTRSADFPVLNAFQPLFKASPGNALGFLTRIAASPNPQTGQYDIVYSTYVGERSSAVQAMTIQGGGIVIAGDGSSEGCPLQNHLFSAGRGFVCRVSSAPSGDGVYRSNASTRFPADIRGVGAESIADGLFITGLMTGPDEFIFNPTLPNPGNGPFLAKLAAPTFAPYYSTFIGGGFEPLVTGLAVEAITAAYVTGRIRNPIVPAQNADDLRPPNSNFSDMFVTSIRSSPTDDGNVVISSSPLGATFTISGANCPQGQYVTPKSFASLSYPGAAMCDVTFASTQSQGGKTLSFISWNDGATIPTRQIPINGSVVPLVALFDEFFPLTVAANNVGAGVGTTNPPAGTTYYPRGTGANLTATAAPGSNFVGWTGDSVVDPTKSTTSIRMDGPRTVYANFIGAPATPGHRFIPVAPCRVADTRGPEGPLGRPAVAGQTIRSFPVPTSNCSIPANAAAYALNVTVVPHGTLGYLTVWPTGSAQPLVSTLNSLDGRIKASGTIVGAGTDGSISVFVTNTTDVVLDITGYFAAVPVREPGIGLQYFPVTPCRVHDTRVSGTGIPRDGIRRIPVRSSPCGIPPRASAYALNATVVPSGPLGYLTLWPAGSSQPEVSTLNALTGTVTANSAIIMAGADAAGSVDAFATNGTELVLDITGYFAPPASDGMNFYPVAPCRLLDTRTSANMLLLAEAIAPAPMYSSECPVYNGARAYAINATVLPKNGNPLGYLTLWPTTSPARPNVSLLNAVDGALTSNGSILPIGLDRYIWMYATHQTDLVLDFSGFFAP